MANPDKERVEMYNIPEAAKRLAVSPQTVRRLIISHRLEGTKVGNQWRIEAESVRKFIVENTTTKEK